MKSLQRFFKLQCSLLIVSVYVHHHQLTILMVQHVQQGSTLFTTWSACECEQMVNCNLCDFHTPSNKIQSYWTTIEGISIKKSSRQIYMQAKGQHLALILPIQYRKPFGYNHTFGLLIRRQFPQYTAGSGVGLIGTQTIKLPSRIPPFYHTHRPVVLN